MTWECCSVHCLHLAAITCMNSMSLLLNVQVYVSSIYMYVVCPSFPWLQFCSLFMWTVSSDIYKRQESTYGYNMCTQAINLAVFNAHHIQMGAWYFIGCCVHFLSSCSVHYLRVLHPEGLVKEAMQFVATPKKELCMYMRI